MTRFVDFPDGFSNANPPSNVALAEESVETPSNGGELTVGDLSISIIKVSGNGGPITLSNTPFGAGVPVGHIIILVGQDDTNTVRINRADIDDGCLLDGDQILKAGDTITLAKVTSPDRFVQVPTK